MANPNIYSIKIPHLLRDTGNMNLQKIELPRAYEVDLKVQITTTNGKEPPTAVKTRLDAAALEVFVYYEKIIKEEAKKLDKKIVKLLDGAPTEANQNKAEIMIRDTNTSIGGALRGAQNAADKAVKAVMVKEAKSNQLLKESKIVAIVKITTNGFKLARSIINLIATSGAALGSYKTAITSMYKIYEEVNNALKSQETRKKELDRQVALLIKDLKDLKNVKNVKNVKNFEAARKLFRDSCTTTRQKADKMSAEADKMMKQATKGGGTFAMEISLVSKCMELKREARAINDKYSEVKTHHDAVAKKVKDNGFTVKDQTLIEKLIQNTPKPTEIFKRIENMKALVYNV